MSVILQLLIMATHCDWSSKKVNPNKENVLDHNSNITVGYSVWQDTYIFVQLCVEFSSKDNKTKYWISGLFRKFRTHEIK